MSIEVVAMVAMVLGTMAALALGAGAFMWYVIKWGIRIGKIPPDINIQMLTFDAMRKFPKVYWMLFLGLGAKLFNSLLDMTVVTPAQEAAEHEEEADEFMELFNRRVRENETLIEWINTTTVNGEPNALVVHKLSGSTYIKLHKNPGFLITMRRPNGTYDDESMARLQSLHPWMVFDLITAHPELRFTLPTEVLNKTKVH